MVTKLDYAFLSWAAYPENLSQIPDDNKWKVLRTSENADTSFAAVAFENSETGEIVIAYRGSDNIQDWWGSNLHVGTPSFPHDKPEQFDDAVNFYDEINESYNGRTISITGHSLGGILSQLVGAKYGNETMTFNSIGVAHLLDDCNIEVQSDYSNITNYNLENDILFKTHNAGGYEFLGSSYVVPTTEQGPVEAHNNIFGAVSDDAIPYDIWKAQQIPSLRGFPRKCIHRELSMCFHCS